MSQQPWPTQRANDWYRRQPWIVGCNYIPSTAVNSLEMWQASTFDPETIGRELGWASGIGLNALRVFVHGLVWEADADGLRQRMASFLGLAAAHGLSTMFVLLDDCWNSDPQLGPQPEPIPGVHNSRWVQCPGEAIVTDAEAWSKLEAYVSGVVGAFADDARVLAWDLYNEPGNSGLGTRSLPLLAAAFDWARNAGPSHPLTVAVWSDDRALKELTDLQVRSSDVVSFHSYGDEGQVLRQIDRLKGARRPVLCTEWLARTVGSQVFTHLALFKREKVGCFHWGLVAGKTQTIYPWGSKHGSAEPKVWFHDLFRRDGAPFDPKETDLFRRLTERKLPHLSG